MQRGHRGRDLRLVSDRAEASRLLGRHQQLIKASSLRNDRCWIDAHIKPLLGWRQVSALKFADIEGAQADIAVGKTSKLRVGILDGSQLAPGAAAQS